MSEESLISENNKSVGTVDPENRTIKDGFNPPQDSEGSSWSQGVSKRKRSSVNGPVSQQQPRDRNSSKNVLIGRGASNLSLVVQRR